MLFPERPKKMTSTTTTKVGVDERDIPSKASSPSSKVLLLGIESLRIEGVFVVLKRFFPKLIFRVLFMMIFFCVRTKNIRKKSSDVVLK